MIHIDVRYYVCAYIPSRLFENFSFQLNADWEHLSTRARVHIQTGIQYFAVSPMTVWNSINEFFGLEIQSYNRF